MRVLHLVASATLTGPAAPALGLVRGLRALGVDAVLACDRERPGNLVEKAAAARVPVVDGSRLSARVSLRSVLRDWAWLSRQIGRCDLIHAHASHDHAMTSFVADRVPVVRSIHHPRSVVSRPFRSWLYERTAGFVVLSAGDRATLARNYPGVRNVPIAVVAGAVDVDRFRPDVDGAHLRAGAGFFVDDHVVGLVARIKPGRGHDRILAAFQEASAQDARLRLAFIGKGEGRPAVEAEVERRKLSSLVRFYGFRDDDLPHAIRSCDVTVLLESGNDASCRAVLESMACGVPVLGPDVPAVRQALTGEKGGWVVAGSEPSLWAQAMMDFFSRSRDERARMGRIARARVLAEFTDAHRARAVRSLYRRLGAEG